MKKFAIIYWFSLMATHLSFGQEKVLHEINFKENVRKEFNDNYAKCTPSKIENGMSAFHKKTELWSVCIVENGNRILKIESHKKETFYQEIYFEVNGKLRYAKETENYMPKNSFSQVAWNVEYFFENGEMVDLISLGHGKTEGPNWNPDAILKMYKSRIEELKKMIKNSR